jgi:hypothetical protein
MAVYKLIKTGDQEVLIPELCFRSSLFIKLGLFLDISHVRSLRAGAPLKFTQPALEGPLKWCGVEGGQLGSGQNVLLVLSGQAEWKGVLSGQGH